MEGWKELRVPQRILMGPGPANVAPQVLNAMAQCPIGHLDPSFLDIMNDVKAMLQAVFQTQNDRTLAVSGTGTAGMETCLGNVIEPGDEVVVCVAGFFGDRMGAMAERMGANVTRLDVEWGTAFEPEQVEAALKNVGNGRRAVPPKAVAIVHAETSTGVLQPLEDISRLTHEYGAFLLVDAVTSLGGLPVRVDEWGIDAIYSGSQKCLGSPPGLAPISVNDRVLEALFNRKRPVHSWYLDLSLVGQYWGTERIYHHTAPINAIYGLRECLRLALEEGLEARWARHLHHHKALVAGIEAMGLQMHAKEGYRLPMLNTVRVPDGIDEVAVRRRLLEDYSIEIAGGLGALRGKIWRIGLMGHSSNRRNVMLFLAAFEEILIDMGYEFDKGAGIEAAAAVYHAA
jgi:alanine-glyoxylate transaminase/serine-glyoxylate transaminase/serine-pyruvate transaminase